MSLTFYVKREGFYVLGNNLIIRAHSESESYNKRLRCCIKVYISDSGFRLCDILSFPEVSKATETVARKIIAKHLEKHIDEQINKAISNGSQVVVIDVDKILSDAKTEIKEKLFFA